MPFPVVLPEAEWSGESTKGVQYGPWPDPALPFYSWVTLHFDVLASVSFPA